MAQQAVRPQTMKEIKTKKLAEAFISQQIEEIKNQFPFQYDDAAAYKGKR